MHRISGQGIQPDIKYSIQISGLEYPFLALIVFCYKQDIKPIFKQETVLQITMSSILWCCLKLLECEYSVVPSQRYRARQKGCVI